eukprot:357106-Ditylum_brightwellii.AAC.1
MRDTFTHIFAVMTNLKETTNEHTNMFGSIQDYIQKENDKQQKHGADDNNLDNVMDELDTLGSENRDALAPDKEGQGGFKCLPVHHVQVTIPVRVSWGKEQTTTILQGRTTTRITGYIARSVV